MSPKHYQVLGLMSGTSMDGVDLAVCHFTEESSKWSFQIIISKCVSYSNTWKERLRNADQLSGKDLLLLDHEYGCFLGNLSKNFLEENKQEVQLIASHGHTIFHAPDKGISYQLGSGAAIASTARKDVVCNFRELDVCLGGQGAPLVPIGDALLFSDFDFCVNLGGIANMSFSDQGIRKAYDICPCNLLLNHYAEISGFSYDKDGLMAKQGVVSDELLNQLASWNYYQQNGPKSLDKAEVYNALLPLINAFPISVEDKLATITSHIVNKICSEILLHHSQNPKVLLSGGGAHNNFMVEALKKNTAILFFVPSAQIIDFKEALIFGFLGLLRAANKINTLASVTGATSNSIGGAYYLGPK